MFGKLKFYVHFLVTFKFLFFHAFQKLFSILKHFLRLDPPYDFEVKLEFDTNTELVLRKINNQLKQNYSGQSLGYKSKWNGVLQREQIMCCQSQNGHATCMAISVHIIFYC